MTLVLDIHALQTVPPSNLNRDDTGAPKTAIYGGVPRHRVSSQSWKRAMRLKFAEKLGRDEIGDRTRRGLSLIADRIEKISDLDREAAEAAARNFLDAAGYSADAKKGTTSYLLFLSPRQIDAAAEVAISLGGKKKLDAADKNAARAALKAEASIDLAAFGRMIADDTSLRIDGAVQVAHAIGVSPVETEFDYFTAVDDVVQDAGETGAGMIGITQFVSSSLYRYAAIDVEALARNLSLELDDPALLDAVALIAESFIESLPSGKSNVFAHNTLPELVYVALRDTRPLSLVGAFESPVSGEDRRKAAAEALATENRALRTEYGFVPLASFALGSVAESFESEGTQRTTLPRLGEEIRAAIAQNR